MLACLIASEWTAHNDKPVKAKLQAQGTTVAQKEYHRARYRALECATVELHGQQIQYRPIPDCVQCMTRAEIIAAFKLWTNQYERHAWLTTYGWEYVGAGSYKTVYGHANASFVVKVHYGAGSCEVENYATAPDHIRPFLVPVEQHAGYQLQERVTIRSCPKHNCRIDGMDDSDNRNHTHAENGDPIIFDYGQACQWDDNDEGYWSDDNCSDDSESDEQEEAA